MICTQDDPKAGDCTIRGVVYKTYCKLSQKKGIRAEYLGESARASWERSHEHEDDLAACRKGSHMYDHIEETHSDLTDSERQECFGMSVLYKESTAYNRQMREATGIMT